MNYPEEREEKYEITETIYVIVAATMLIVMCMAGTCACIKYLLTKPEQTVCYKLDDN